MLSSTVMTLILSGILGVLLARLLYGVIAAVVRMAPVPIHNRMGHSENYELPVDIARRKLGIRPRHMV